VKTVFADSVYWIALLNRRDGLHEKAVRQSSLLADLTFVTSEMVLVEVLNYFAETEPPVRTTVSAFIQRLRRSADCQVVPQTPQQFEDALSLYQQRSDKNWSLTDCASILVMQAQGLQDILTEDRHFQQAGFRALLRE
jgi:predicted nucleic acid-binding protein